MAIAKFGETSIAHIWQELLEKDMLCTDESYGIKTAYTLFTGATALLSAKKNQAKPTAFIIDELNGNFVMGAVVEYHAGKDKKDPGNWSYAWTFNKSDIPENAEVFHIYDGMGSQMFFDSVAMNKYNFTMLSECIVPTITGMAKTISKWLDDNVNENDIVGVELDGVFQARVAVEGGEVVKSIEVIGDTKAMIKNDASIEV